MSNSTVALTTSASATVASDMAASATAAAVSDRTLRPTHGYRALVAVRALLETAGSFRSLDVWLDALLGEDRQALESSWHCKRLVTSMAKYEKELTHRLLREGAVFRLQADGLDRTYQVEIGTMDLACVFEALAFAWRARRMAGGVGSAWSLDCRADHRNAGISSQHGC